ncbi:MAG: DUF4174 domain-containing protein [Deltaproteobacteria bacterium]|nr:DUF4174 domain-containing protein [Deltaproteobacteria bacterium]
MATFKKYLCTTLLLFMVGTMAAHVDGQDKIRLKDYQWKHRLILAFSPSAQHPGHKALEKEIAVQAEEVMDRDLLVFHFLETGEIRLGEISLPTGSGDYFRENFSIRPGRFTVLLIGKDGGVKLRREGGVELDEILSLIDTMPMRQREMREKAAAEVTTNE